MTRVMEKRISWDRYTVLQMWDMIKHEKMDIGEQQAGAWRNTATLCEEQANRLDVAAAQLAETWIPNPGTAAEMFQLWVRQFTTSMRQAADTATKNASTILDITHQLTSARDRLQNIVIQGNQYIDAEEHQLSPAQGPGQILPQPTGIPLPPEGWQQTLHAQAKSIMATAEAAVIAQAARIQHTPKFDVGPPSITPVNPLEPGGGSGDGSSWNVSPTARTIEPPAFPASFDASAFDRDHPGPAVDGSTHPPGVSVGQGSDHDGPVLDSIPNPFGMPTSPRFGPFGQLAPSGPVTGDSSGPDGPFGLSPGSPAGPARAAGEGRSGTSVGGVGARSGSTAMTGAPIAPMVPPAGIGRPGASGSTAASGRAASRRRRPTDPPDEWSVPQGGPAVIEPKDEPEYHDPGPGVIGIDR